MHLVLIRMRFSWHLEGESRQKAGFAFSHQFSVAPSMDSFMVQPCSSLTSSFMFSRDLHGGCLHPSFMVVSMTSTHPSWLEQCMCFMQCSTSLVFMALARVHITNTTLCDASCIWLHVHGDGAFLHGSIAMMSFHVLQVPTIHLAVCP